jgi:hypothetical protein
MQTTFVVIARDDAHPDGTKGRYSLCTRTVFFSEKTATEYLAGISPSREPVVVPGDWAHLRVG